VKKRRRAAEKEPKRWEGATAEREKKKNQLVQRGRKQGKKRTEGKETKRTAPLDSSILGPSAPYEKSLAPKPSSFG